MIVFPLTIRGQRSGTMVFYSHQRVTFRDVDVQVGTALANLAAAALTTADLYEEQRQAPAKPPITRGNRPRSSPKPAPC